MSILYHQSCFIISFYITTQNLSYRKTPFLEILFILLNNNNTFWQTNVYLTTAFILHGIYLKNVSTVSLMYQRKKRIVNFSNILFFNQGFYVTK